MVVSSRYDRLDGLACTLSPSLGRHILCVSSEGFQLSFLCLDLSVQEECLLQKFLICHFQVPPSYQVVSRLLRTLSESDTIHSERILPVPSFRSGLFCCPVSAHTRHLPSSSHPLLPERLLRQGACILIASALKHLLYDSLDVIDATDHSNDSSGVSDFPVD